MRAADRALALSARRNTLPTLKKTGVALIAPARPTAGCAGENGRSCRICGMMKLARTIGPAAPQPASVAEVDGTGRAGSEPVSVARRRASRRGLGPIVRLRSVASRPPLMGGALRVSVKRAGTESLRTPRWRKADSNRWSHLHSLVIVTKPALGQKLGSKIGVIDPGGQPVACHSPFG